MTKLKVGILGARGALGQEFVECLVEHPLFEINSMYGSRSAGMKYAEATGCSDLPEHIGNMRLKRIDDGCESDNLIFSTPKSKQAGPIEEKIAKLKPVFSTTSAHRMDPDVPVIVPYVNENHYMLIETQQRERKTEGYIVAQSNCTAVGLAVSLYPIHREYGVEKVRMVSMQSVSGAGHEYIKMWDSQRERVLPKAMSHDETKENVFEGNVIPYIKDEEEKIKRETLKILGSYSEGEIRNADIDIDCLCNRVPVLYGHMESVFIRLRRQATADELKDVWRNYVGEPQKRRLPSAPERPIVVLDDRYRPQPRLDATRDGGMVVAIGRVEKSNDKNEYKYDVLSHNTQLGGAKGLVLTAEYLYDIGKL